MASPALTPAKAVLLAVQLASEANIPSLRTLISLNRKTLDTELVLRILLSHLPESLESSKYVPLLEELNSGFSAEATPASIDASFLEELNDADAKKQVRKLHLLTLAWPECPADAPADPFTLFLIHRSLRIDESTGLIAQLPELLTPFVQESQYLRTWMISTIIPLVRLNYEYHPEGDVAIPITRFENLDERVGIPLLLSRTGKSRATDSSHDPTIGRDIRGLVGPWMYGDVRWKRRKFPKSSTPDVQAIGSLDQAPANDKYLGWEEVFKWMTVQAVTSWKTAVEAIEQWDGPGDVDLGGYEDSIELLNEDDQQELESKFARAILATAYLIPGDSEEALDGVQRVLVRLITLADRDRIPTLQAAAALLTPISSLGQSEILAPRSAAYLRNNLLENGNPLTSPSKHAIKLLHALLLSAFLCTRAGCRLSVRDVGQLVFLQEERDQKAVFTRLILAFSNGPKADDKYWVKMRNEILWLRSWGAEELSEEADSGKGRGVFGSIPREFAEAEILKLLLAGTRKFGSLTLSVNTHCIIGYDLARSIYETSPDQPLSKNILHSAIISSAMDAYDNATNANRTRGGIKKCNDM
jgi:hypothetical protein